MHAVGCDEPLGVVFVAQLQEFRVGDIGVAGAVGAEDRTGQLAAGA